MFKIVRHDDIPTKTIQQVSHGLFVIAISNETLEIYHLHLVPTKEGGNSACFISMRSTNDEICQSPTIEQSIEQMLNNGFRIFEFESIKEMAEWMA
jgi:hypothetical protein